MLHQVGPGVEVLCRVRARPCDKAITVMNAQLKAQEVTEGEDTAAAAKRRRLASFFVQPSKAGSAEAGGDSSQEAPEVIVAIRKGNIVATAFHPELTNDSRWHEYFVRMVRENLVIAGMGLGMDARTETTTTGIEASTAENVTA